MKKAAGYVRVSTEAQAGQDRYGLDSQRADIEAYARAQGYELAAWYTDAGQSGAKLDRPGLQGLLHDAERFDVVIVAKLDRIARDLMYQLWIEKELLKVDVDLVSVAEPVNGRDPAAQLFRQLIGAFAEFERGRITERLTSGRKTKARLGGYAGGRPALGYAASGRALKVDTIGAEKVQAVFALRSSGLSLRKVADTLNSQGVASATGTAWHKTTVKRVLDRADLYRGRYEYAGIQAPGQQAPILGV